MGGRNCAVLADVGLKYEDSNDSKKAWPSVLILFLSTDSVCPRFSL